jgi:hypothetical protein
MRDIHQNKEQLMSFKSIMIAACFSLFAICAHAGFVDNRTTSVTVEIEASYHQVAVEDLVAGLVPANYAVFYESDAGRSEKVSVSGKGAWGKLLSDGLGTIGMSVDIDDKIRSVHVKGAPHKPVETSPAAISSKSAGSPVTVAKAGSDASTPLAKVDPTTVATLPAETWTLKAGASLEGTLREWSARAGRDFLWEYRNADGKLRDFRVKAKAEFVCDFSSAVQQLSDALQADKEIYIEESGNNLVHVTRGVNTQ